jgi:sarcosine oxidase subunit alpha
MFRRLASGGDTVSILVDGVKITARAGDSVAAALMAADVEGMRTTPVSGALRAPYCMMGVCFDCLATVDGIRNRQTCLIPVREGMQVERQVGGREAVP